MEAGILAKPHTDNELCKILTKLDCNIGRLVLKRQECNKTVFSCVADIAAAFEADLKAKFPKVDLGVFAKHSFGGGDVPDAPPPPGKVASRSTPDLGLYELGSDGSLVSPLAILRKAGFDVGMKVVIKAPDAQASEPNAVSTKASCPEAAGTPASCTMASKLAPQPLPNVVYTIAGVTKSDVKLDCATGTAMCEAKDFVSRAVLSRASSDEPRLHAAWPKTRTMRLASSKTAAMKARIMLALHTVTDLMDEKMFESLDVFAQPVRKVVVTKDIPPNGLVLVPETLSITELGSRSAAMMKPFGGIVPTMMPSGLCKEKFVLEPRFDQGDVCPFWYVTPTEETAKVNMSIGTVKVQLLAGADLMPPIPSSASRRIFTKAKATPVQTASGAKILPVDSEKKTEKPKAKAAAVQPASSPADKVVATEDDDACLEHLVEIPVLFNASALKTGTELKVFFNPPPPPSRKTKVAPITVTQVQKRGRV